MQRRDFIALLGVAASWPFAARAQQPTTKVPRIGWPVTGDPTSYRLSLAAFRDGLRALNYVEGRNIGGLEGSLTGCLNWLAHESFTGHHEMKRVELIVARKSGK